jgi:hypothetical protein
MSIAGTMASRMEEMAVKYFGDDYKPLQLTGEIVDVVERFFKGINSIDDEQMLKEVGKDIEMREAMKCYLFGLVEEELPRSFVRICAFEDLY